jgi:hypothetical protein
MFTAGRVAHGLVELATDANGSKLDVVSNERTFLVLGPDRAAEVARLELAPPRGDAVVCDVEWTALIPEATCLP